MLSFDGRADWFATQIGPGDPDDPRLDELLTRIVGAPTRMRNLDPAQHRLLEQMLYATWLTEQAKADAHARTDRFRDAVTRPS